LQDALRALVGSPISVELATVLAPVPVDPYTPGGGALVQLMLQPGNRPCEARWASPFAGPLAGLLIPMPVPGQECIVAFPADEPRRAVILAFLHGPGGLATRPPTWNPATVRLQNPLGVEFRSVEGIPADGIVLGNFLVALQTYVQALELFVGAAAAALTADATLADASAAFIAATAAFKATLATSAAFVDPDSGGVGGAPFASTLVRSTV